jgi:trehalose synthase
VSRLLEVEISALPMDRLRAIIGEDRLRSGQAVAAAAREAFAGRTIWNVNSTAVGGGVAEMLQVLLAYANGAGIDTRWLVIEGDPGFFAVTKRLHNRLHGIAGDGGGLGVAESAVLERRWAANAAELAGLVRPGDVVLLHDPQTAGLVAALGARGATVVWRCHIGADAINGHVEEAWEFLRGWLEAADAFVFSRRPHVHAWMPEQKVAIIPPSIDPLSPKNQPLDTAVVRATLGRIGFLHPVAGAAPPFRRRDGSPGAVTRRAAFPRRGAVPTGDTPLIVQVSRWDRLKDMAGVLQAFAEHVPPPVHLALVGPTVEGVADDPEGAAVLGECVAGYDLLPRSVQARVHLVSLPVDDPDENAVAVNAFQRHATVVVQKSLQEGFGLTVTEAMLKARPIVASRVGGIQDQIRHEREGLLVDDPADLVGFAAAANRLLADPALAGRLGAAACSRAVEEFVGDRHLTRYAGLLRGLIAGSTPRGDRHDFSPTRRCGRAR